MTWKPTAEMIEIAEEAFSNVHDMDVPWKAYCEAVTIAVQPLIAEEATAPLKAELEASMAEIAQLRIDLAEMKMDANADVIRPHIAAEARATALEEAELAVIQCFGNNLKPGSRGITQLSGQLVIDAIRSLLEK